MNKFKEKLVTIFRHHGLKEQIIGAIDAMEKLLNELSNDMDESKILTQIVNVYIMLGQLEIIWNISESIIDKKIEETLNSEISSINIECRTCGDYNTKGNK